MTQIQLLSKLATKFWKIGTPIQMPQKKTHAGVELWTVQVLLKDGEVATENVISYWKVSPSECYWKNSEPLPSTGFVLDVKNFVQSKIANGSIQAAYLEKLDRDNEKVVVSIITNSLNEKKAIVDKDSNGDLQYRLII